MRNLFIFILLIIANPLWAKSYQRIISLAPHATELAFAAGLGNQMVAVSDLSDYPPEAEKLEKVASYQGIKLEKILALKPDLVITWPTGNPMREIEKLKNLGIEIYESEVTTLDQIAESIDELSQYADNPHIGQQNAQIFRTQLAQLHQQYKDKKPVKYFYQLSEKPIITIAQDRWPSEVFRFCGGINIFQKSLAPYPQVGIEQVLLAQPDVIFTSQHAIENGQMWSDWIDIPAVKNNHIWSLNSDWINRATPRTINAVKEVCEYLDKAR